MVFLAIFFLSLTSGCSFDGSGVSLLKDSRFKGRWLGSAWGGIILELKSEDDEHFHGILEYGQGEEHRVYGVEGVVESVDGVNPSGTTSKAVFTGTRRTAEQVKITALIPANTTDIMTLQINGKAPVKLHRTST
jgi:hypothetical protein